MGILKRGLMRDGHLIEVSEADVRLANHILWIEEVTGLIEHGGDFLDPETGDLVSREEAEDLARLMDDPVWQREQRLDAGAEWCGEHDELCKDQGWIQ